MIFSERSIKAIRDGTKRQTRRVVKDNEQGLCSCDECLPGSYDSVHMAGVHPSHDSPGTPSRLKWRVGYDYAICPGRGKKQVARICITGIRRERLQDISDGDLLSEGVDYWYVGRDQSRMRRNQFKELWNAINAKRGIRWNDNPEVWVLEFKLVS